MPNLSRTSLTAMGALLAVFVSTANGDILTYGFSGVITHYDNHTDLPVEEAFPIGTPWEFVFTFDSTVPLVQETLYPDIHRARFNVNEETSGRMFNATVKFEDQLYSQLIGEYGRSGMFGLDDNVQFNNEVPPEDYYVIVAYQFPSINSFGAYNVGIVLRGARIYMPM